MEAVMVCANKTAHGSSEQELDHVSRRQMPLTFMRDGESASVIKVRGNDEVHHHLEKLGFVPGAELRIVSEQNGSIIVEIKGAQIALDRKSASKVIVCELQVQKGKKGRYGI